MRPSTSLGVRVQQHAPAHWIIRAMLWRTAARAWFWRWLPFLAYVAIGGAIIVAARMRGAI